MATFEAQDIYGTKIRFEADQNPTNEEIEGLFENLYAEERTVGGQAEEFAKAIPRGFANSFLSMGEGLAAITNSSADALGYEENVFEQDGDFLGAVREGRNFLQEEMGPQAAYADEWTTKFGEGVGSFATFLTPTGFLKLAGMAGKILPNAAAVTALTGTSGAGEGIQRVEQARASGIDVTQEQENEAVLKSTLVGFSELAPVGRVLRFLPKGSYPDTIRKKMVDRLVDASLSGGIEGAQEVAASYLQDAVERNVYNPDLAEKDSFMDEFTVGAGVGALAELVLNSAAGRRKQGATQAEIEKEQQEREVEENDLIEDQKAVDRMIARRLEVAKEGEAAAIERDKLLEQRGDIDPAQIEFPAPDPIGKKLGTPKDIVSVQKTLPDGTTASFQGQLKTRTSGKTTTTYVESQDADGKIGKIDIQHQKKGEPPVFAKGVVGVNTVGQQESVVDRQVGSRKLGGEKTSAAVATKNAKKYAQHIRSTMDKARGYFPTNKRFIIQPLPSARFGAFDSSGQQYGSSFETYDEAAQLASALHDEAISKQTGLGVLSRIESSPDSIDEDNLRVMQRVGRRIMHPLENLISFTAVNEAAGTTQVEGFDEISTVTQLIGKGYDSTLADLTEGLTASQKINRYRLSKNLPEVKSFSPAEIKTVLGKDFIDKLPDSVYFAGRDPTASQDLNFTPIDKNVSLASLKKLLIQKNISSKIDSPEIDRMVKSFVGAENVSEVGPGGRKLLAQRIATLPRFTKPTKLVDFTPRTYTADQLKSAISHVENNKDFTEQSILESTNIDPSDNRATVKVKDIITEMNARGVLKNGKSPVNEEIDSASSVVSEEFRLPSTIGQQVSPDLTIGAEERTALLNSLRKHLDRYGLKDVGLNLEYALQRAVRDSSGKLHFGIRRRTEGDTDVETIDADGNFVLAKDVGKDDAETITKGYYSTRLNNVFLSIDRISNSASTIEEAEAELINTLDHEAIHAMRQMDLWTDKEWQGLEKAAKTTVDRTAEGDDAGKTYLQIASEVYSNDSAVIQMEEAIANMTRDARASLRLGGKPRSSLTKVADFFRRIISFLRGSGYQSFNDLIDRIESGEVGSRERGSSDLVRTLRATEGIAGSVPERGIIAGGDSAMLRAGVGEAQQVADFPAEMEERLDQQRSSDKINFSRKKKKTEFVEPKKTVKAYKLFKIKGGDTSKLYPLFVNANKPVEVGEWIPAEIGPVTKEGKVKSKLGSLAFRPGWHSGELPVATHIGEGGKPPKYRRADEVWAEIEVPADVDWQAEANSRARVKRDGAIDVKTAHITDGIPEGGFYKYKTNPNMYESWVISGAIKVNKVLADAEVSSINQSAGTSDLPRNPKADPILFSKTKSSVGKAREMGMTNTDLLPTAEDLSKMKDGSYVPEKKRSLIEAAQFLQNKWEKATGRNKPFEYNDENVEILSDMLSDEAIIALEKDNNAIGWYDRKLKSAKAVMNLVEPRINESPENEAMFDFALAVTSNGQAVTDNFEMATEMFRYRMDNGRFPNTKEEFNKGGERNQAMLDAFKFYNGWEKTSYEISDIPISVNDFLNFDFTVKDLKQFAKRFNEDVGETIIKVPSAEGANVKVKGSYVLGPKIGQGFYQNIRGNYDPLTMDIWWMRMWNRAVGRPFTARLDLQPRREELISLVKDSDGVSLDLVNEVLSGSDQSIESISQDPSLTDQFLSDLDSRWQRYFKDYKAENGINPKKPELFKKTGTFKKNLKDKLQATPAGPTERSYMRRVTDAARGKLSEFGYDITTADFQALMWYPEKQLFRALGVQPGRGSDNDYLDAAELLAAKEGVERGRVEEALRDANRDRAIDGEPSARRQDGSLREADTRRDVEAEVSTGEVGVEMGINVRTDEGVNYSDLIVSGQKKYETRDKDSLRPYIGKRVGIVETGSGPANLVGYATVGDPIEVGESEFNDSRDLHLVPEGSKFDIKPGQSKFLYEMLEPTKLDQPIDASGTRGIIARNISALPREDKIMESRVKPRDATPSPIPEQKVADAVRKDINLAFDAPSGDTPRVNFQASPEAQYVGNEPEKSVPPTREDDVRFSRSKEPEYNPGFEEATGSLSSNGVPKETAFQTYNRVTDLGPIDYFLTWVKQKTINKFARLESMSKNFMNHLGNSSAMSAALMTDRAKAILGAAIKYGTPTYKNGTVYVEDFIHNGKKYRGLMGLMAPLHPGGNQYEVSLEELAKRYAIFKRSEYLAERGLKTPLENPAEAEAALMEEINKYVDPETGKPIVAEWYEAWQSYNNKTIDFLKDTGMIDDQGARDWQAASVYYPFYKQAEEDGDVQGPYNYKGLTGTVNFKSVGKSERAIDVPMLEAITKNLDAAIDMGMKNIAQQRIIRDAASMGFARELGPKEREGDMHVVTFKVDGVQRKFEMYDPLLFQSLQAMGGQDLSGIVKMLGFPANVLREMVTREPGFVVANMFRDTLSAFVTSGSNFIPVVDTVRGFATGTEQLEKFGVVGGYDFNRDPKNIVNFIARESRKSRMFGGLGKPIGEFTGDTGLEKAFAKVEQGMEAPGLKAFKMMWQGLGAMTTKSDASTRQAVFNDVLARTGNYGEAQIQALEVINFARRGSSPAMNAITAMIPFLNARLQGLDVLYRGATGKYSARRDLPPGLKTAHFLARGSLLIAGTALYYSLVSDDDEYKSQDDYVKDDNFIIPLKMFGIEDMPPLKLPVPFEVGVLFKTIPERIMSYMNDESSPRDVRETIQRAVTNTLEVNPPQFILPLVEAATNHNLYTGRSIVPVWMDSQREPWEQYKFTTNELAVELGKTLKMNPMKIEHLMSGYSGTLGGYLLSLTDSMMRGEGRELPTKRIDQYPLIRRFFARPEGNYVQSEFYDLMDSVKKMSGTVKSLTEQGRLEELDGYLKTRYGLASIKKEVNFLSRKASALRRQKENLLKMDIDPDLKQELTEQIDKEINQLLQIVPELKRVADQPAFEETGY